MIDGALISLTNVRFGYSERNVFLGPISMSIDRGALVAVVGPNGSGKSTLLRLMVGLLSPHAGSVALAGERLDRVAVRERARRIAFLPQSSDAPPDLVVRDVVLLGRFPHRRFGFFDSVEDGIAADQAMKTTRTHPFAERSLDTLSTGERQRVHLAAALAQEPELLVLDEPTSALDPYHQLSIFGVLRRLCDTSRVGVVVATHDLNLAGQFADTVVLLDGGSIAAMGSPRDVLRADHLERVYGVAFRVFEAGAGTPGWVMADPAGMGSQP